MNRFRVNQFPSALTAFSLQWVSKWLLPILRNLTASLLFRVCFSSEAQHSDKWYEVSLKNVSDASPCHSRWCRYQQEDWEATLSALGQFICYVLVLTSGCDAPPYAGLTCFVKALTLPFRISAFQSSLCTYLPPCNSLFPGCVLQSISSGPLHFT